MGVDGAAVTHPQAHGSGRVCKRPTRNKEGRSTHILTAMRAAVPQHHPGGGLPASPTASSLPGASVRPTREVRPTCFTSAFFPLTFHQDINLDSRCCKNSWKNSHDFSGCQFHVPFRISTVRALAPSSSPRDGLLNDLLLRGLRSVPVVASMLTVADLGSVPVPPDEPLPGSVGALCPLLLSLPSEPRVSLVENSSSCISPCVWCEPQSNA